MAPPTLIVKSPQKLRIAMSAAGLDGQQLATSAGVTKQFMSFLIRGRRRCNPAIADRIAQELNTETADLFTIARVSEESDNNMESNMPNAVEIDDPCLRFDQVAELLNIKPKTLRALRAKKAGPPFFNVGQTLMIRRSKALAWFRETYEDAGAE